MIKGSVQEDDRTIINVYAANKAALKYIKQILIDIKEETNSNAIILVEFNNLLSSLDQQYTNSVKKKSKGTLNQMNLIDIHRILHAKASECIVL